MNYHSISKKSKLENFRLFYEAIPIPEVDPHSKLQQASKTSSYTARGKRIARPRS